MITLKINTYKLDELEILQEQFQIILDVLADENHVPGVFCENCPARRVCDDVTQAQNYITRKIKEKQEKERCNS